MKTVYLVLSDIPASLPCLSDVPGITAVSVPLPAEEKDLPAAVRSVAAAQEPDSALFLLGIGDAGTALLRLMADRELCSFFRGAVVCSALSNPYSAYGISRTPMYSTKKEPHQSFRAWLEKLQKDAPIAKAADFSLPCLILHGKSDRRYEYTQAEDLFSALKLRQPKLPVRLAVFPGEDENLMFSENSRTQQALTSELTAWAARCTAAEGENVHAPSHDSLPAAPHPALSHMPAVLDSGSEKMPAPAGLPDLQKALYSKCVVMEDYLRLHYVGSPACCSEAGIAAWMGSYWDSEPEIGHQSFREQIFVSRFSGKPPVFETPFVITAGGKHETEPAVLRDGTVLFLSDASIPDVLPEQSLIEERRINEYFRAPQLWAWKDGSVRQLTHMLHGISRWQVSPDETKVLFASSVYTESDTVDSLTRERSTEECAALAEAAVQKPITVEQASFKADAELGYKSIKKNTHWTLSIADGALSMLCGPDSSLSEPVWSPDSSAVVYYKTDDKNNLLFCCRQLTAADNKNDTVLAAVSGIVPSFDGCFPCFTPDGSHILFAANLPDDDYNHPRMPYIVSSNAGPEPAPAVPLISLEESIDGILPSDYNFASRGTGRREFVCLPDGFCYFTSALNGNIGLFRVPVVPEGLQKPEPVITGAVNFHDLVPCAGGLLVLCSTPLRTPEVVWISADGKQLPVSSTNPWLCEKNVIAPEELWTQTLDGYDRIHGWLLLPPNRKPGCPVIVMVHGGPNGFFCSAMNLELQAYAAAGFAVLWCNPRGGSGYGRDHGMMKQAWGDMAMNDILQVLDEALRLHPELDRNRVGITGGSYGGYETLWSVSHCARYRAGSAMRPLASFHMITNMSHNSGGQDDDGFDSYRDQLMSELDQSPNTYADRIHVPLQLLESTNDANCIPEGPRQLFASIRDLNPSLPCRLVLYPDSCHGLLHRGPMHLAVMQRNDNLNWFRAML